MKKEIFGKKHDGYIVYKKNKKNLQIKRETHQYVLQYVVIPAVLILSDIMIGVFSHYSGAMGIENIFCIELYSEYFTNHFDTFLIIIIVAISISLTIEWLIRDLQNDVNGKKKK